MKAITTTGKAKELVLKELGNETVQKDLMATVFKGFDAQLMRRAVFEGILRGFEFKDFLEKNVYAIKYGNNYSLVTSIDHARKRGMHGGVVGTDVPTYTMTEDAEGKPVIESCTVTVKKMFEGGHVGEFSAQVFFDEYYQAGKEYNGKYTPSMWDKKPRTMIAKVAEMHALRKACPDELSQAYVEEEMMHADVVVVPDDVEAGVDEKEVQAVVKKINGFKKLETLQTYYTELGKPWVTLQDVIDAYEAKRNELQDTPA